MLYDRISDNVYLEGKSERRVIDMKSQIHLKKPDGAYWSDIRQIIKRHYEPKISRYLLGGRRNTSEWEYYYNSADFETAYNVASLINDGKFSIASDIDHISFQIQPEGKCVKAQCPCMLKLKETDKFYEIDFFAVTGYEAVRSYGSKIALRLSFMEKPLLQLLFSKVYGSVLQKTLYGGMASFRFSWWTNRLLRENEGFRMLFTEFIERLGESQYIYKDIARCISKDHFCLIDAPMRQIEDYYNPDDLVRGITQTRLNIDFNKKDLNYSFYIAKLADQIEERDWGRLLALDDNTVKSWISLADMYHGPQIENFTEAFYQDIWSTSYEIRFLASEYAHIICEKGEKISLRISSERRMRDINEEEHRRIALLEDGESEILVPENSKFRSLKSGLPKGFEWITTKTRLFDEGTRQHNCVYSYRGRIRQDLLAIVHWETAYSTYTIEIRIASDGTFRIAQMKGINNTEPAYEDYVRAAQNIITIRPYSKAGDFEIGNSNRSHVKSVNAYDNANQLRAGTF